MSLLVRDGMMLLAFRVLKGLEASPKHMDGKLELSEGAVLAERIVNMLVEKGVARQDAYDRVRRVSVRSLDSGVPFSKAIQEDSFVSKRLTLKEIKEALDYRHYLGVTSQLINMALKE